MEGQLQALSSRAKRVITILPILLTLFSQNVSATEGNPSTPDTKEKTNTTINIRKDNLPPIPFLANLTVMANNLAKKSTVKEEKTETIAVAAPTTNTVSSTANTVEVKTAVQETVVASTTAENTSSTIVDNRVFSRRQLVAFFAESQLDMGLKYRFGGESLESGLDCSAFVRHVLNYFDIKTDRTSREQFTDGQQVPYELSKPGDLVFFGKGSTISHVAMVVENSDKGLFVVHCTTSRGVVKENILESSYWKPKLKPLATNIIGD